MSNNVKKYDIESVIHTDFTQKNIQPYLNSTLPIMESVKRTAEIWGISQHYARQLALTGLVKAVRVGRGKILINQQSVAEYFNSAYLNESIPAPTSGITPIAVRL